MTCTTCHRDLHRMTIKHGYKNCRRCRSQIKYRERYADESLTGRIVGEAMAKFYEVRT